MPSKTTGSSQPKTTTPAKTTGGRPNRLNPVDVVHHQRIEDELRRRPRLLRQHAQLQAKSQELATELQAIDGAVVHWQTYLRARYRLRDGDEVTHAGQIIREKP